MKLVETSEENRFALRSGGKTGFWADLPTNNKNVEHITESIWSGLTWNWSALAHYLGVSIEGS